MIQTNVLNCPSCGAELLDPIYDLEMVDGGRRRLTCGECGRPFTVEASLVYDVTADGEPSASPLADAVLAAFHQTNGSALRAGSIFVEHFTKLLGSGLQLFDLGFDLFDVFGFKSFLQLAGFAFDFVLEIGRNLVAKLFESLFGLIDETFAHVDGFDAFALFGVILSVFFSLFHLQFQLIYCLIIFH